jgi:hypothetical protein
MEVLEDIMVLTPFLEVELGKIERNELNDTFRLILRQNESILVQILSACIMMEETELIEREEAKEFVKSTKKILLRTLLRIKSALDNNFEYNSRQLAHYINRIVSKLGLFYEFEELVDRSPTLREAFDLKTSIEKLKVQAIIERTIADVKDEDVKKMILSFMEMKPVEPVPPHAGVETHVKPDPADKLLSA